MILLICCCQYNPKEIIKPESKTSECLCDKARAEEISKNEIINIFGEGVVLQELTITSDTNDSIWIIDVKRGESVIGGTSKIVIRQKDCEILEIVHGK